MKPEGTDGIASHDHPMASDLRLGRAVPFGDGVADRVKKNGKRTYASRGGQPVSGADGEERQEGLRGFPQPPHLRGCGKMRILLDGNRAAVHHGGAGEKEHDERPARIVAAAWGIHHANRDHYAHVGRSVRCAGLRGRSRRNLRQKRICGHRALSRNLDPGRQLPGRAIDAALDAVDGRAVDANEFRKLLVGEAAPFHPLR